MSRHKYTKKELIALLKGWALKYGETPSQSQWDADVNMPSSNPIRTQFGSWGKGLLAAGMTPKIPTISERCARARNAAKRGSRSSNWKGGRIIEKTGYVSIWKPEHPNAKGGRDKSYVLEHRLVMSEHLGRPLLRTEQVHHRNGDRADNRIENLELWSTSQPAGQRVEEKLKWAKEFINIYESHELLSN